MKCPKHGCVITETITDDVFCGVCRAVEKDARIAELEKLEEPMRQVIDYCTYVQANSRIAREVLKIVKDCGL